MICNERGHAEDLRNRGGCQSEMEADDLLWQPLKEEKVLKY